MNRNFNTEDYSVDAAKDAPDFFISLALDDVQKLAVIVVKKLRHGPC